ncbi:MAG: aldehyde ferredoxin oxidoreductase family protein [Chloroflexota bacterium]
MQPILKVNLTTGNFQEWEIPEDWKKDYLGGASLAARILYEELTPDLDPLSPEASLLFLNGPLSGTSGPTVGRFVVCAKSPATGLWGESNCGGFWGPELRKAGYDGVWITGKAETPVYLKILNDEIEIVSANHLWGQDTYEIQKSINQELDQGRFRVTGIGIAGENLIPSALILADHGRVAGRTGMGAVMGAKNLKALAVRGTGKVPLFGNQEKYSQIRSASNRMLSKDNLTLVMREMGSSGGADYFDYLGEMPKRYFTRGVMEGVEKISGATITETILAGVTACHACVVACGRLVQINEDGEKQKGPEYETIIGFGPNLWINDLAAVTVLGDLCDHYGIDTISVSNTIGLAFRLYELGFITQEHTGGIELEWGDAEVVETLVHLIARQEGFGTQLAMGARAFGNLYEQEEEAVQVNGLELAYHDPRGSSGMALVYATSPRGGCHNQSDYYLADIGNTEDEIGMQIFSRQAGAEKANNVKLHQDWRTLENALVLCLFGNVLPSEVVELINAAVGLEWSIADMMEAGERAWNLKRVINNRLGLRREYDRLPKALMQPLPDGGSAGFVPDFDSMLRGYYQARDWDWDTGFPTKKLLDSLGLNWAAEDLWPKT